MDIPSWIKEARLHAKLTQEQLGAPLGVGKGNVSAWEKGRHEPSYEQLVRISKITHYPEPLPGMRAQFANVTPADLGERRVPLLNYVQAGAFTEVAPGFGETEHLVVDIPVSDRAFALQIKGDSMRAPPGVVGDSFLEGDRVIIDCNVAPRPGSYVVARNGGNEATFKKYRLVKVDDEGREIFELSPINPDYPSVRSDEQALEIIGTMVEHRRYYRGRV